MGYFYYWQMGSKGEYIVMDKGMVGIVFIIGDGVKYVDMGMMVCVMDSCKYKDKFRV